jgi:probable phosphoglycerate mutase
VTGEGRTGDGPAVEEDPVTQVAAGAPVVTVEPPPDVAPPSAEVRSPAESAAWTGQTGAPTRLLLLRHGETPLSIQRRYSGQGDPELTSRGHDQAEAAAARLAVPHADGLAPEGVAAVLTSPLRRARQTAAAVADALDVPLVVREALIETDFGGWEGLTFAEAAERDPELHARWLGDEHVPPPGGESFADVGRRLGAELAEILAEYPGATVVVVSHVTPIKLLLRAALAGGPEILYRLHLDLASLSVADFYPDGGASVRLFNDTGHLPRG